MSFKLVRSVSLGGFFLTCLIISLSSGENQRPVDQRLQDLGILLISLGILSSYLYTFGRISYLIFSKVRSKLAKKGTSNKILKDGAEDLMQEKRGLIFYTDTPSVTSNFFVGFGESEEGSREELKRFNRSGFDSFGQEFKKSSPLGEDLQSEKLNAGRVDMGQEGRPKLSINPVRSTKKNRLRGLSGSNIIKTFTKKPKKISVKYY